MSENSAEPSRGTIDLSEGTLSKSAEAIGLTPSPDYVAPLMAFDKAEPPSSGAPDEE